MLQGPGWGVVTQNAWSLNPKRFMTWLFSASLPTPSLKSLPMAFDTIYIYQFLTSSFKLYSAADFGIELSILCFLLGIMWAFQTIYPNKNLYHNISSLPFKVCFHHKSLLYLKKMARKCSVLCSEYSLTMFVTQFKFCFLHKLTLASPLALRTFPFVFSCCFFKSIHYYVFHVFTLLFFLSFQDC